MSQIIYIFGHSDREFKGGWEELESWLREELVEEGRYRYIQKRTTDIILLSFKGLVKGELKVAFQDEPTPDEIEEYKRVYDRTLTTVYIISEIQVYEHAVRAADFDVKQYQFGKLITPEIYNKMRSQAGNIITLKIKENSVPASKRVPESNLQKSKILEGLPNPTSTWNEEDVKIKIAVPLLESLGYSRNDMKLEVPIKFGSTTHKADIVVRDLLCEVKSSKLDFNKELNEPDFVPKLNSDMIWRDSESFLPSELNAESLYFKTLEGLFVDILATQSNLHVFLQDIKITLIEFIHTAVS